MFRLSLVYLQGANSCTEQLVNIFIPTYVLHSEEFPTALLHAKKKNVKQLFCITVRSMMMGE